MRRVSIELAPGPETASPDTQLRRELQPLPSAVPIRPDATRLDDTP